MDSFHFKGLILLLFFPLVSKKRMLAYVFWLELFCETLDEQLEKPKNQAVGFHQNTTVRSSWGHVQDHRKLLRKLS